MGRLADAIVGHAAPPVPATVNLSSVSFTGLESTVIRLLVPAFTVGFDESIVASSVGANVSVEGVVAVTVAGVESFPVASNALTL